MKEGDISDSIDKYVQGRLDPAEKLVFEQKMELDPELKKEVTELKMLVQGMGQYYQRKDLQAQMQAFHEEMEDTQRLEPKSNPISKSNFFSRNYYSLLGIAAAITLVTIFTAVLTWDNILNLEEQQSSAYRALRRSINRIKKKQDNLIQNQKAADQIKTLPVKEYGGTAFVISSAGYLLTNYHVIKNADSIYVETKRDELLRLKAEEIYSDRKKDIAVLKITDTSFIGFAELPFTFRTEEADLGESVYTLAYPRKDMVYGEGSISARSGYKGDTLTYQISIPVNPGNSGGPLMDENGFLIGLVTGKLTNMDGTAFAIKTKYLQSVLDTLVKQEEQAPIPLPAVNHLQFLRRPEQIKRLKDFVFLVKVYEGKKS
ncbi:MAG: trypsin-like peptidase domain-containing protein [Bacteroidota bacterium]